MARVRRLRAAPARDRDRTGNVVMPDVEHCGGLLELTRIAAVAKREGVSVAPHNPGGPVSTAASVQVCVVLENFRLLEFQWGESPWRQNVVSPPERFETGRSPCRGGPGLGIQLNDAVARARLM